MSETVEARVTRGAAWLDENEPGWERRVDLAVLELKSGCRCVLGQVFSTQAAESVLSSGFSYAMWELLGDEDEAIVLGFDAEFSPQSTMAAQYAALDEAWIALLKERFSNGTLSDEAVA